MRYKRIQSGLRPLYLTLCLTSCAGSPSLEVVRLKPPLALLGPCATPALRGDTSADLARWALQLRRLLTQCNEDKTLLKHWATKEPH